MAENEKKVTKEVTEKTEKRDLNKKVKIKLIAYRDGHNKARYLGVGSKSWLIPRGVEVSLPLYAVMRLEKQKEDFIYV